MGCLNKLKQFFENQVLIKYYIHENNEYMISVNSYSINPFIGSSICDYVSKNKKLDLAYTQIEELYDKLTNSEAMEFKEYMEKKFNIQIDNVITKRSLNEKTDV